jgi:hypothetical protein
MTTNRSTNMNSYRTIQLALLLAMLALLHVTAALSKTSSQYALIAGTVSSGGTASAGQYRLAGAVGQVAAGTVSGGGYAVTVGFLAEPFDPPDSKIYLPLIYH